MEGMLNYYIPDDGDSPDHMNICSLPQVDPICLKHIKKAFPLPGNFHFRFKKAFEGTYVWLDLVNDEDRVPSFNDLIVCKISRIQKQQTIENSEKNVLSVKQPEKPVEDLIKTFSDTPTITKSNSHSGSGNKLNDDIASLLSEPITQPIPKSVNSISSQPSTTPSQHDPFNLFSVVDKKPQSPNFPYSPVSQPKATTNLGNPVTPVHGSNTSTSNTLNNGRPPVVRGGNSNFMDLQWPQQSSAPQSSHSQPQIQQNQLQQPQPHLNGIGMKKW